MVTGYGRVQNQHLPPLHRLTLSPCPPKSKERIYVHLDFSQMFVEDGPLSDGQTGGVRLRLHAIIGG